MLIPETCALCGCIGVAVCKKCTFKLLPPTLHTPKGLDGLTALFSYEGVGKRLIKSLKFSNHRGAFKMLATEFASQTDLHPDLITWVPSSKAGFRERGYDTGKVFAKAIGKELKVPTRVTLKRVGQTRQTKRSGVDRLVGPELHLIRRFSDQSVILVDDVCTTGSSLLAASKMLKEAGAAKVWAVVAASTPVLSAV